VPDDVRRVQEISIDSSVLFFAVLITVVSAALFGIFPALQSVRTAMIDSVRGGREGASRAATRTRGALVVTQLAMAVMLLVGAGLLLRSFLMMQRVDLGYRADGVAITGVTFPAARYQTAPAALAAIEDLLTRLRANATIRTAEVTDLPVLSPGDQDINAVPVGEPANLQLPPSLWIRSVTSGYLKQMHMRLVAGRQFTPDDRQGVPLVGILNEYAAERYFPGKDPIGRVLARGSDPTRPASRSSASSRPRVMMGRVNLTSPSCSYPSPSVPRVAWES
jgi:hypothetical protein